MRLSTLAADAILRAGQIARNYGHSYVGSAHLLVAMASLPGSAGQLLRGMGVEPELTGAMVQLLYGVGKPDLPLPQGLTEEARCLLRRAAREAYLHTRSERSKAWDFDRGISGLHFLLGNAPSRIWDSEAAMRAHLARYGATLDTDVTPAVDFLVVYDGDDGGGDAVSDVSDAAFGEVGGVAIGKFGDKAGGLVKGRESND